MRPRTLARSDSIASKDEVTIPADRSVPVQPMGMTARAVKERCSVPLNPLHTRNTQAIKSWGDDHTKRERFATSRRKSASEDSAPDIHQRRFD
ncbi:hypothetical protein PGTUg99_030580 [Puccinia graminis f. sp. tritici]|uniref:Uncharacterized protein n=1 Tax=Puccinia graminis f. sp. tritici TaxID=56615 RepID=A0A5B0N0B7_PUCGR|nr:hypothetical protein PGTUg99_030580 [Puccinia graminis f. sp. tritici]